MPTYNVARLQEFYFEGSLRGYAGGGEKIIVSGVKKTRRFVHQRGELYYRDEYVVNGEYSGGSTIIYVDSFPVWLMQYHGWCKDDDLAVLAFLKQTLLAAHTKGEWNGGRGPGEFAEDKENGLVYMNWPLMPPFDQSFRSFMGRERIWRQPDKTKDVFWHQYQGLLLGEPE